jgi:hypothetical protein
MATTTAPCSKCLGDTLHQILRSYEVKHSDEVEYSEAGTFEDKDTYEIIKCAGCGRVSFAHLTPNPGFGVEGLEDEEPYYFTYYPHPVSRKPPSWTDRTFSLFNTAMPPELSELGREIYEALWARHYRLALMGIRALLEQAMIRKVGDHGSFSKNLDAFGEDGFISRVQRDHMRAILEAGHASTHRMYKPTESDLDTVLEIAEGIVGAVYVHGTRAKGLSGRVPVRRPTGKVIPIEGHTLSPKDDGAE